MKLPSVLIEFVDLNMRILRLLMISVAVLFVISGCGGSSTSPSPAGSGGNNAAVYTIGGMVTGLNGALTLQNNGGDNLTVSANGKFTFVASVTNSKTYNVSVLTQPNGQTCTVSTGTGTVSGSNVTNVSVICSLNTYKVGGTVTGLSGSLVLQDNNGDNLAISANGNFNFASNIANGSPYSVTVLTQPVGQSCSVVSGTGTITSADITNIVFDRKPRAPNNR